MKRKPLRVAATRLLRLCGLYHPMRVLRRDRAFRGAGRQSLRRWEVAGRPAPPLDILKYARIREYAKRHGTPIFEELSYLLVRRARLRAGRLKSRVFGRTPP